jgi:hypothetical protein
MTSKPDHPQTITWQVIGAAVQGASHLKKGIPCQDAYATCTLPDGSLIIVIADGAGSAARSEEGARHVVGEALALARSAMMEQQPATEAGWRNLLTDLFAGTRVALHRLAAERDAPAHVFSTTLACAIAAPEWLAVGQIGDSVVVAGPNRDELFTAIEPQRGEYANETFFLNGANALEQLQLRVYPHPMRLLVAMTDGVTRLAIDLATCTPHLPFFGPLLAFAARPEGDAANQQAQLSAFLASERVCARTGDDKTLVVALRADNLESGQPE